MRRHRLARVLVHTHGWLGVAGGVLFIVWFISGIVMIYARMPALDPLERLARLPAINHAAIRVLPPAVANKAVGQMTISTLETRPVVHLTVDGRSETWFADTGDPVPLIDEEQALRIARAFHGGTSAMRYDVRLSDADRWSFSLRGFLPLHRVVADDPAKTTIYVSESSGEVVLKTTASGRFWGGVGPILHSLYLTPIHRHGSIWRPSLAWIAIAATVLCVAAVGCGVRRIWQSRGHRLRNRGRRLRPFGSRPWHRCAGVICGAVTTLWILSGLFAVDPWGWQARTTATREQRLRVSGGLIDLGDLSVSRVQTALRAFAPNYPKEVEVIRFRGGYYAAAAAGLVSFDEPQFGPRDQLPADRVFGAAGLAMIGVSIDGVSWLDNYDAYYYDRERRLSLPVLRVRYDDPQRTWLYFDPRRGEIARREERWTRLARWIYPGFHRLDFPFLNYRRPLWDVVVITLSLGGIALSVTIVKASWRRVRRKVGSPARLNG